jgi:hypothetical protein
VTRATEQVWCADSDGVVDTVTVRGHDGPLTDLAVQVVALEVGAVSEHDLLAACLGWSHRRADTTLCEAYAAPEDVERLAASEFVTQRHGQLGSDRPGFPVVVRAQVSCEQVRLQAAPAAAVATANDLPITDRLRPWEATERFNEWRAREAVWRSAADDGCLDIAAARAAARAAQGELAGDWPVFETVHAPDDRSRAELCFDVRLHRAGFIEVSHHAALPPLEATGRSTRDAVHPDASSQA